MCWPTQSVIYFANDNLYIGFVTLYEVVWIDYLVRNLMFGNWKNARIGNHGNVRGSPRVGMLVFQVPDAGEKMEVSSFMEGGTQGEWGKDKIIVLCD